MAEHKEHRIDTLSYRLRHFSELTGRDLSATASFAEVWLAIRAAGQLGLLD
ncbi:helix-turn-helix domain-containing protein [Streptomyces sp. NPDC055059]|uniref:Helix-turn-helix domain-containing protein n=1 Tax=Streptomyces sp. NBC_00119 TaxID=2975659 RepID=A0AAU1TYE3_9ACTN|nr:MULTISPECIES: helix-turn-helix domain-containing protein [unclassified Streptomyces]MCX4648686.1 helix-turn-helix domain-containing protein [Streptomyces sp. NBC_01446]MCX5323198.1 helix-turn-helix domain-containing protein [Streptomyces sp. NBC_00120]